MRRQKLAEAGRDAAVDDSGCQIAICLTVHACTVQQQLLAVGTCLRCSTAYLQCLQYCCVRVPAMLGCQRLVRLGRAESTPPKASGRGNEATVACSL